MIRELQAKVASMENKQKIQLTNEILDMKASAGLLNRNEVDTVRQKLMSLSLAALEEKHAETADVAKKILDNGGMMESPAGGVRLVHMPNTASGSTEEFIPRSVEDLRKMKVVR
jgi:hypothetical protein